MAGQTNLHRWDRPAYQQAGVAKVCNLRRRPRRFTMLRIHGNIKHVIKTASSRQEINQATVGRPVRFVVPGPTIGQLCPFASRGRDKKDRRRLSPGRVLNAFKGDPASIRQILRLEQIEARAGGYELPGLTACRDLVRWNLPNLSSSGSGILG